MRIATSTPDEFRVIMVSAGVTVRRTSELLHVSIDTVKAWLKPPTSKSANAPPLWAIELLRYKIDDPTVNHNDDEYAGQESRPRPGAAAIV